MSINVISFGGTLKTSSFKVCPKAYSWPIHYLLTSCQLLSVMDAIVIIKDDAFYQSTTRAPVVHLFRNLVGVRLPDDSMGV